MSKRDSVLTLPHFAADRDKKGGKQEGKRKGNKIKWQKMSELIRAKKQAAIERSEGVTLAKGWVGGYSFPCKGGCVLAERARGREETWLV